VGGIEEGSYAEGFASIGDSEDRMYESDSIED